MHEGFKGRTGPELIATGQHAHKSQPQPFDSLPREAVYPCTSSVRTPRHATTGSRCEFHAMRDTTQSILRGLEVPCSLQRGACGHVRLLQVICSRGRTSSTCSACLHAAFACETAFSECRSGASLSLFGSKVQMHNSQLRSGLCEKLSWKQRSSPHRGACPAFTKLRRLRLLIPLPMQNLVQYKTACT